MVAPMEERHSDVAAVTLAFRGVLVDLDGAEETLVYELARRHGLAPMDRGRALARRLRALEAELGSLSAAVDALATERGFRWAPPGGDAVRRIAGACRTLATVRPALERLEIPAVAVAAAEPAIVDTALRPLDGAFAAVVTARGPRTALRAALARAGAPAARVVHVGTDRAELRIAAALGMRTASPAELEHLAAGGALAAAP
jgi:phosphoglycolate phosphatase-like HAD superfamily hydrolase